jgi:uncharacterized phage protein (TIGR01671 family)
MNDRFRFRAWDKEEKEYYYDAEQTHDYSNGIMSGSFGELLEDDRYIVEQCTGIKDCNGKLIFEGDLIRFVVDGKVKNQGVVEWCNARGDWAGAWQATDYSPNGTRYPILLTFTRHWEVCGNKHEMEIEK